MKIQYIVIFMVILLIICNSAPSNKNIENMENNLYPRILHLVLYSEDPNYDAMYRVTREYYKRFNNVTTIYYKFSDRKEVHIEQDMMYIPGNETYIPGILEKTVKAMKKIQHETSYQYIVRSNISTLINFNLLSQYLVNNSFEYGGGLINNLDWDYYNKEGIVDSNYIDCKYVSGTAIIMRWDFFQQFMNHVDSIDYRAIDDVAIGLLIKKFFPNITPYHIDSFIYVNKKKDIKPNIIFYRNRTNNRKNDVNMIKSIININ
jgi:hypothetical protein